MKKNLGIPALLLLSLGLSVPALAQSIHQQHADAAKAATAADPDKSALLHEEYVAKTAELRGKLTARQAELEVLLATKPGDEAAIKKLAGEIATLRGALFEQATLFRVRFARETGTSIRLTRGFDGMGHGGMGAGHGGMMAGHGGMRGMMDLCGGKGMMNMKGMSMPAAPKADDAAKAPADKP